MGARRTASSSSERGRAVRQSAGVQRWPRRDGRGRLASDCTPTELYRVVRDVAEHVTGHEPVPDFLLATITQRDFDDARAGTGHPGAPSARAICMRLARPRTEGGSLPWRRVLELACSDVNIKKWQVRNEAVPQKAWFGERHLVFALRLAARHLSQATVLPAEYQVARRELIDANRRRARRLGFRPLLEVLLPTVGQIERIVRGLRDADVDDRDRDRDRVQLIEVDVVVDDLVGVGDPVDPDHHHDQRDEVDDDREEDENADGGDDERDEDEEDVVVRRRRQAEEVADEDPAATSSNRRRGGEWDEALEHAGLAPRRELHEQRRGGATPAGMPVALAIHNFLEVHGTENGWPGRDALQHFARLADTALADIKGRWQDHLKAAQALRGERGLPSPPGLKVTRRPRASIQAPTEPLEGAVPRRNQRTITREMALADLRTYDENAPAGQRRTQAGYRAYATKHGLVAASRLQKFGRFQELLKEAQSASGRCSRGAPLDAEFGWQCLHDLASVTRSRWLLILLPTAHVSSTSCWKTCWPSCQR